MINHHQRKSYTEIIQNLIFNDIESIISTNDSNFAKLNKNLENVMNKHAPLKTKFIRGNNQAHATKELRKEIMTRSRQKKHIQRK